MSMASSANPKVLLVIESSRGNGREFLRGISKYADEHSPWQFHFGDPGLFYRNGQACYRNTPSVWFPQWRPTGVITCDPDLTKSYTESGIPTILAAEWNHGESRLPRVVLDHKEIGLMAAREYLDRNYHYFGYCGFDAFSWSLERGDSYSTFLVDKGCRVFRYRQEMGENDGRGETDHASLGRWLQSVPKPIGIFACNDDRGRDLLEACRQEQIKVPEEVAVLGVDSDPMVCNFCMPSLSSIRLDVQTAGYQAAKLLDQLMQGHTPEKQTVLIRPLKVEVRMSTDRMAVKDPEVKQALGYIHQNSHQIIQVNDVVQATAVSKRKLQAKFHEVLGRSIKDEIKRASAEKIAHLLIQTDLTVKQIAIQFGYKEYSHIARFFKKQTGLSPTEYRKRYRNNFHGRFPDHARKTSIG